jgi:glycosyltransferase involved in cell wall biosynthesis
VKILHIIKSLGRGGAETLLPETIRSHNLREFEFYCIYFLPWKDQMVNELTRQGATVACFPANNNLLMLFRVPGIIRYIKKHKIELLHCHLPWAGFVGRIIFKLTGIKVLYTEHNLQERYHFITRLLNRLSFNWQTAAVGVSADVVASIRKNISIKIPVTEILNGVDARKFTRDVEKGRVTRQKFGIAEKTTVVGTIAVFRFQKRLSEWVDVAERIVNQTKNVRFMIVGDGPLRPEIEKKIEEKKLKDFVLMPGLHEDVTPFLSAIDIYMMSSSFEGLPVALLEALSMQCAIVTTLAGGISEVITEGIEGYTVPVEQWLLLSDKVVELIDNPHMRLAMSQRARNKIELQFSMPIMVDKLERLYRQYR